MEELKELKPPPLYGSKKISAQILCPISGGKLTGTTWQSNLGIQRLAKKLWIEVRFQRWIILSTSGQWEVVGQSYLQCIRE